MRNAVFLLLLAYLGFAACSRKTYAIQPGDITLTDTSHKKASNTYNNKSLGINDAGKIKVLSDSAIREKFSPHKVNIDYTKASALQCYHYAIFQPEGYRQICSFRPFMPYQKEFTPFYIPTGEFYITTKQNKAIRARRDSTIAIIKNDTNKFSDFTLMVVMDLNAVELLPDLIDKANKLNENYYTCIEKGKDWTPYHLISDTSKYETDWPCYNTTYTLGNILSTITALLKQEAYPPLLSSGIIKSGEAVSMKKKNVDMILGWAQDYLKDTPESVKKDAYKRMSPL